MNNDVLYNSLFKETILEKWITERATWAWRLFTPVYVLLLFNLFYNSAVVVLDAVWNLHQLLLSMSRLKD